MILSKDMIGSWMQMRNWTNGIPPFAYSYEKYKYNEKGLVVNDEEADVYRYIVKKPLEGVSPHKISWDFQGIKTKKETIGQTLLFIGF